MEYEKEEEMKLNIGCGWKRMEGYVGVDIRKSRAADVVAPAWDLPYDDASIKEIFTSHMLEHLDEDQVDKTLKEWHRVLRPNGKVVIRTPDIEKYMELFLHRDEEWKETWGLRYIFGYQRRAHDIHYTGWWKERFRRLLPKYGFKVVVLRNVDSRQKSGPQFVRGADVWVEAKKV